VVLLTESFFSKGEQGRLLNKIKKNSYLFPVENNLRAGVLVERDRDIRGGV
jgi:hypothetical protein